MQAKHGQIVAECLRSDDTKRFRDVARGVAGQVENTDPFDTRMVIRSA
jgi:hypothetical protein